jgi:hypothetical protein
MLSDYDVYRIFAFFLGPGSVLIAVNTRQYLWILVPYCILAASLTILDLWGVWFFIFLLLVLGQFGAYIWWSVHRHDE